MKTMISNKRNNTTNIIFYNRRVCKNSFYNQQASQHSFKWPKDFPVNMKHIYCYHTLF